VKKVKFFIGLKLKRQ